MDPLKFKESLRSENWKHQPEATPKTSNSLIHLSVGLTLMVEFIAEKKFPGLPTGIFFPVGFFMFWGVYYLYKESSLSDEFLLFKGLFSSFKREEKKPEPQVINNVIDIRERIREIQMPLEIQQALKTLGLDHTCKSWSEIHRQFRVMAKRYHPDLNSNLTDHGNRFIACDTAYRTLNQYRNKLFF